MSTPFRTVLVIPLLILLPGLIFPAIYLAYRRTRLYRIGDINRLASSVSAMRPSRVDAQTSGELKNQLLEELDDLYNWKNYAVSLAMCCLATFPAPEEALQAGSVLDKNAVVSRNT